MVNETTRAFRDREEGPRSSGIGRSDGIYQRPGFGFMRQFSEESERVRNASHRLSD
jgi:hypothetical protein